MITLECIGCRKDKQFESYSEYPVCGDCKELENKKFQAEHTREYSRVSKNEKSKEKIPDSVRWAVWERDNFTCLHCGTRKNLTVDHIHPESKGGEATLENCQTLCKSCNSRKGAR